MKKETTLVIESSFLDSLKALNQFESKHENDNISDTLNRVLEEYLIKKAMNHLLVYISPQKDINFKWTKDIFGEKLALNALNILLSQNKIYPVYRFHCTKCQTVNRTVYSQPIISKFVCEKCKNDKYSVVAFYRGIDD